MLKIYGLYRSRATRPLWLLGELGVPFAHVPVTQAYKLADPLAADAPLNTLSPAFRALSPAGAIPVIEDAGFVLAESLAITLYLAKKHGGPLAPADPQEEALMLQWALYGTTAIEEPALEISFAYARGEAETEAGRARIAAAEGKLLRPLAVLEAHLATTGQIVGDRFTVADLNMAEIVRYAQPDTALMARFPGVTRWLEAAQARPAFQAMWAARTAEPA